MFFLFSSPTESCLAHCHVNASSEKLDSKLCLFPSTHSCLFGLQSNRENGCSMVILTIVICASFGGLVRVVKTIYTMILPT